MKPYCSPRSLSQARSQRSTEWYVTGQLYGKSDALTSFPIKHMCSAQSTSTISDIHVHETYGVQHSTYTDIR